MASGHVNRANRPNTWPQPTSRSVKKTLANREPSTHGTSRKWNRLLLSSAWSSKSDIHLCPQQPQGYLSQLTPGARIICLRLMRGEANMTKGLVTEARSDLS